ncbi:ATP-dependent DNA helicase Q-like 4A [Linum perenne]
MAAEEKFIWRIENFSTFTAETELHSPTFSLKGHQWVSHGAPTNIPAAFKEDSTVSGGGFKASSVWVPNVALASGGFLVDDTLIFEAQIRKSLRAMVYSNLLTVLNEESGGKTEACPPIKDLFGFRDATLQDISNRIPRTKAQLLLVYGTGNKTVAMYGDRLLQTIESTISNYYAEEASDTKGNDTSDSAKRTRECATIEPSEAITSAKRVAQISTIARSPCSSKVRSASKNLIAKLSTMASSWKSTSVDDVKVSTSEANHGSALLQEQRGKLAEFFEMSLEAICQSNWFDSVHEVVLKISDLATDPFEKRILMDLLSRLVEFRRSTPEFLSIVESSPTVETSNVHGKKQIEGSLLQRQNQLTFLDSEVSRIEEDQLKVDAEIEQLLARKDKLVHEKNSALAEMEAANREASMELGDLERKQAEHEQARDDLLRAMEKLAQNNLSWKLFKENLGL